MPGFLLFTRGADVTPGLPRGGKMPNVVTGPPPGVRYCSARRKPLDSLPPRSSSMVPRPQPVPSTAGAVHRMVRSVEISHRSAGVRHPLGVPAESAGADLYLPGSRNQPMVPAAPCGRADGLDRRHPQGKSISDPQNDLIFCSVGAGATVCRLRAVARQDWRAAQLTS